MPSGVDRPMSLGGGFRTMSDPSSRLAGAKDRALGGAASVEVFDACSSIHRLSARLRSLWTTGLDTGGSSRLCAEEARRGTRLRRKRVSRRRSTRRRKGSGGKSLWEKFSRATARPSSGRSTERGFYWVWRRRFRRRRQKAFGRFSTSRAWSMKRRVATTAWHEGVRNAEKRSSRFFGSSR